MGMKIPISHSFNLPDGQKVTIETGKLATQADGSVMIRVGNMMMLATVCSAHEPKENQSFFPLSVDYQEKFAAAGRIPGNFFRREGRLSDPETLICRLVDRPIRPLFPKGYMNETQVIITLISGEKEILQDAYACLAASAAIAVSDIPFDGPVSEVRIAKIDGVYVINPSRSALKTATLEFIVAGTLDNILMVEGEALECQESEMLEALKIGHEAIKVQCQAQLDLAQLVGDKALVKRERYAVPTNEEVKAKVEAIVTEPILALARAASDKASRKKSFTEIKTMLAAKMLEENGEEYVATNKTFISYYFDKAKKNLVRGVALNEGVRLDGRKLDEVRPIWTEIDFLPAAHGSAIFNRGETQALMSLALGTKLDELMVDTAMESSFDKFILHYNFPGFSVGEVKPQRGPGRREVGHAALAARSLRKVLPANYPYTMRLVSDVLESNGSSSMATVCSGSLALMDAGIPIKTAVAGIAMGLICEGDQNSPEGQAAILSDILGDEDALGDMDFKVTGTTKGITGCQMDMKIDGLSYDLLEKALKQATAGLLHILGEMAKTIETPREELKAHAPRIIEIIIESSFIGAVIGPGGKVIQEMQRETGCTINIEEKEGKGHINVFGTNKESMDIVVARINDITYEPQDGEIWDGKVENLIEIGAIIKFKGKTGLLHVSEISYSRVEDVSEVFKIGDPVRVQVMEIDKRNNRIRLSRKVLMEKPEGYVERPPRPPREDDRRGGGRDDRRGGGGGRDDRRGGSGGGFGGGGRR
jgi:polyribonucleotide nucleotidyltransferase